MVPYSVLLAGLAPAEFINWPILDLNALPHRRTYVEGRHASGKETQSQNPHDDKTAGGTLFREQVKDKNRHHALLVPSQLIAAGSAHTSHSVEHDNQ
jgi:hypothetical protein